MRGLVPQHFLRQVVLKLLPEDVWARKDKCNVSIPGNFWMWVERKDLTEAILIAPESSSRGIFRPEMLKQACQYGDLTWSLINVELWLKIFIDLDSKWIDRIVLHAPHQARVSR